MTWSWGRTAPTRSYDGHLQEPVPTSAKPSRTASAKFIWFGTEHLFDGLTFVHRTSEHGSFAVHGYPISAGPQHLHRRDRSGTRGTVRVSTGST